METTDIKGGATPEEILQSVYKQLQGIVGRTDEKQRNANTLADAVKVKHCPEGLVGCNSAALSEATAGILNCPPLSAAPDPLIVDPFGVCYSPESLRDEWKDKHVSIDDLINEYSKELLLNLQNSNSLRRAMEEAATGATNRVAVNNIFTSSPAVGAAAATAGISFSQASAFLSVFSDKISTEGGKMLASFVRRGAQQEILISLFIAMLYSRTSRIAILRNYNTLGRMYTPDTASVYVSDEGTYLPATFLRIVGNFWVFSLKMIILSLFSKVNDGYFIAVAAAKNSYQMLQQARRDLAQARARPAIAGGAEEIAGGDEISGGSTEIVGGQVQGGIINLTSMATPSIEDLQKRVVGASKAFDFKRTEIAEALSIAFSDESITSATKALEEMNRLAPSLTDVPMLGEKLLRVLRDLFEEKRRLADFMSKGTSLAASMRPAIYASQDPLEVRNAREDAIEKLRRVEREAAARNFNRSEAGQLRQARAERDLARLDLQDARDDAEGGIQGARAAGMADQMMIQGFRDEEAAYQAELRAQQRAAYREARQAALRPLPSAPPGPGIIDTAVGAAGAAVNAALAAPGQALRAVGAALQGVRGGSSEDYVSDSEFYGGEDMSPEMRAFLEGGEELKGGLAPPAHTSPEVIRKAVGNRGYETADEKKVRETLAAKGYPVTVFDVDTCPTSINKTGNTYGTGNKWVETKNPWALCQAQMGYQFKTPNGFCYPEGMSCYDPENVIGARKALERTLDKAAIWQTLASTLNSIKRNEYDAWLLKKKAEIRADPANYEITDKEVDEIVQLHMPPKFKSLPNSMAVQTMVTVSAELANAIDELNPKNDDEERKKLSEILETSGTFEASWRDANPVRQSENIERIASGLVVSAKNCTDVSIKQHEEVPRNIRRVGDCEVLDIGGEKAHVPSDVFNRIDIDKIEKGEPVDPLVMWWRKYDNEKKKEHAAKIAKLRNALDPHNDIESPQKQTILAMAKKALSPGVGRDALKSHL